MSPRVTHLALVRPADHSAAPSHAERRSYPRHTLAELPWLNGVRLKYGPSVSLIDLSEGGAQIETSGYRLKPGSTVVVQLAGQDQEYAIPSRVLRCQVTGLEPQTTYRGALIFKNAFEIPSASPAAVAPADLNPAHQHARLAGALRRVSDSPAGSSSLTVGSDELASALAMLDTPAGRRAGAPFARELSGLFAAVTKDIEAGSPSDSILSRIEEKLLRIVPARVIRTTEVGAADPPALGDVIYFDVPSAAGGRAARLLVEFPPGARPEEWHFQFLRAAVHVIAMVKAVDRGCALAVSVDEPAPPFTVEAAAEGWSRAVVRYLDGKLLKGYTKDFTPSRGHVYVWPVPDAPAQSRVSIPLAQLKAIFFVRDFDGNSGHIEAKTLEPAANGRRIAVTFVDNELLTGTTMTYNPEGAGFFLLPMDAKSNNEKVFVVSRAVRQVQFP